MQPGDSANTLVSVCIPAYNAEAHIRQTIQSVLDSTYETIEVVVSDDASVDGTRSVIEAIPDPRVRYYRNESNLGPVGNWNRSLSYARGGFVSLLNHDDRFAPEWLAVAVKGLQSHPEAGWSSSDFHVLAADESVVRTVRRFGATGVYQPVDTFPVAAALTGMGPGFIARREVLDAVGPFDPAIGPSADNDMFVRLSARFPLFYAAAPLTARLLHASNLTRKWGWTEQTAEGLHTLRKAFASPDLASELRQLEAPLLSAFYRRVVALVDTMLRRQDLAAAQELIDLLGTAGRR